MKREESQCHSPACRMNPAFRLAWLPALVAVPRRARGAEWREKILEYRSGVTQGGGRKAEQMVFASNRSLETRGSRRKDGSSARGVAAWKPFAVTTVRLAGPPIHRQDAMDAEKNGSESLGKLSLEGGWFERPPAPFALCAHGVLAVLLPASRLNGCGSAGLLVPVVRSSIGAFCFPWLLLLAIGLAAASSAAELYVRQPGWVGTMVASRAALEAAGLSGPERGNAAEELWFRVKDDFPVEWDWALQDGGAEFSQWFQSADAAGLERRVIEKAVAELGEPGRGVRQELDGLIEAAAPGKDRRWLELYVKVCEQRRQQRLKTVLAKAPRIVFTKHRTIRPSFFAYTEGQSDAQDERHFLPDSELCVLEMEGLYGKVRTLVADATGAIRDPAVSWDGTRVVFAWKKSLDGDDYHLYELNVASNVVRQITTGLGFADYEPAFLPSGDLIFSSTRCVQTVDCWWTEASNLYTCNPEGRYLRRLGFDQVHTVYPQVMDDGRVIYTRWDYNDRGQVFVQPLFQMYPDGTGQTEFYGNNSWFPTTIAHARGIPGTQKVMAILCGHHTPQAGKLAVIDPARGREENAGVQLVAPVRDTPAERIDGYGQEGELWQYPWPLNEQECLVTYAPLGWDQPERRRGDADFGIYWMDVTGRRELLAWDPRLPCSQPVALAARRRPLVWANRVDYYQIAGTYYVQDIYAGAGLAGVPRGTIRKLRVVGLEFRAAGVGHNGNAGPAGGALISTPVSIGNGAWDVKFVLGEAKVYEDGSALFTVPARRPVYFQALDERGCVVQTMRSWSTLQPGEYAACVGCHEPKNTAPPARDYGFSLAMKAGPQPLEPFYGPPRGFSFPHEIQPILDRHCIRCHKDRRPIEALVRSATREPVLAQHRTAAAAGDGVKDQLAFSLLGEVTEDRTAKRRWSDAYLVLTQATVDAPDRPDVGGSSSVAPPSAVNAPLSSEEPFHGDASGRVVNWIGAQSVPEPLPPYSAGAARSGLLTMLEQGHQGVKLSREELDKIACWIDLLVPYCGNYREANAWTEDEMKKHERYAEKRRQMEEVEQQNIDAMLGSKEPARGSGPAGPMMQRRY